MISNLSQIQISGLIAFLVSTSFLIGLIRNVVLSNASKRWPKVSGTITEISDFGSNLKYRLQYSYSVNGNTYKNNRIIFSTSKTYIKLRAREFENKYTQNQIVDVFYNPKNPKQAVLEPGRNDGAVLVILLLFGLMILSSLAIFNQTVFLQMMNQLFQIFN
jgi:hypothetical protein